MPTRAARPGVVGHDAAVRLLPPTPDDRPFLREMLAEAAFPLTAEKRPGALDDDHVARYLTTWGEHPGDVGLVAVEAGRRIGAAWAVHLPADRPGYGWVAPDVPELAVAAGADARGRGVGRALVTGVLDVAAAHGTNRVSLSVNLRNAVAHGLYGSLGFAEVERRDTGSVTMVAPTNPRPPLEGEVVSPARRAEEADGPALARLRQVMLTDDGDPPDPTWVAPFLRLWSEQAAAGRWLATVAPGPDGRPVASALAALEVAPPAPGRPHGRAAHVSSVATDPGWRRRGAAGSCVDALLALVDEAGVEVSSLNAAPGAEGLYLARGYAPGSGRPMFRRRPGA